LCVWPAHVVALLLSIRMATIQQLKDHLAANNDIAYAFSQGLKKARTYRIPQLDPIKTVGDLINYFEEFLTWIPSEDAAGKEVYNRICLFYFVLDCAPLSSFQTPILPSSSAPWSWLSNWIINYALELGSFLNTPESLTKKSLESFYKAEAYNPSGHTMEEDYGPIGLQKWTTFNEFFARHVLPGRRPIDAPHDHHVIISPADSAFDGSWDIDANASVDFEGNVVSSKGLTWSITELLKDSKYGPTFAGGKFAHAFLSPANYHRQHAPVAGVVKEVKLVHGQCYLQVIAQSDDTADEPGRSKLGMIRKWRHDPAHGAPNESFDAPDSPGYQFLQSRGVVIIENPVLGLVAVLPMGMAQVSSVVLKCKENQTLRKGDEISHFQFGGSDIVLVFQKHANVTFTAKVTNPATVHYVGQQIAVAAPHRY
jgi:phosphatidylserine decarboxylase